MLSWPALWLSGWLNLLPHDRTGNRSCQAVGVSAIITRFGVWRSPVAHLLWEQGVQGSNPCTPTSHTERVVIDNPLFHIQSRFCP